MQGKVVVVGSANLDVVLTVDAIPAPGETVLARDRATGPGGKGANQAVAAARAGASTAFVGAVGAEDAGRMLRAELIAAGVDVTGTRTSSSRTGTAYVLVDRSGENAIVVDPGANGDLTALAGSELELVRRAAVVLCQLEVPVATVLAAVAAADGLSILNAAPAQPLPAELTDVLDVLVVNEHEALVVAGARDLDGAIPLLVARVPEVLVTLGAAGVLVARRGRDVRQVPAVPAREVVDTTGAGDTFCGAYAAARAGGAPTEEAVRFAAAAASLSVERPGAARSAPTLAEVRARLADG